MGRTGSDGLIYLMTRHLGPPKPKKRDADDEAKVYRGDRRSLRVSLLWILVLGGVAGSVALILLVFG